MVSFSIVVPVYNAEKYIETAIHSVLKQTYSNYELILVNDGSTDKSAQILDEYAEKYENIRAVHIENEGVTIARQKGIELAVNDYIVFMDADDALYPTALETLNEAAKKDSPDCVIYGFERKRDLSKPLEKYSSALLNLQKLNTQREIFRKVLSSNLYNSLWRKCFKTEILKKIDPSPFQDYKMGEDLLHSLYALQDCQNVILIDNVLYAYYYNPDSVTSSIAYENYVPDYSVRMDVLELLKDHSIFTKEDMVDYRSWCIAGFIKRIMSVGYFQTSFKNKKGVCTKMRQTPYYRTFLSQGEWKKELVGSKAFIFELFAKEQDQLLLTLLWGYRKTIGRNKEV